MLSLVFFEDDVNFAGTLSSRTVLHFSFSPSTSWLPDSPSSWITTPAILKTRCCISMADRCQKTGRDEVSATRSDSCWFQHPTSNTKSYMAATFGENVLNLENIEMQELQASLEWGQVTKLFIYKRTESFEQVCYERGGFSDTKAISGRRNQ
jgi:hypothetical protein